jgi:3-mercaptopyruvate sulfurtransferase SseA
MSTILTALAVLGKGHLPDARLYDGSIVDWTRRKLPAVTGPQIKR